MPPIPIISEAIKLLIVLLEFIIFDALLKDDILDMFVSFDEVIILEL